MALTVYLLCALAGLGCALLLARGYRRTRAPLLFWGAVCFFILVPANALLFFDLVVFKEIDLSLWRTGLTISAYSLFLYGLIFESQS
jgi:hypothetical protein